LNKYIDHTLLKATATSEDIIQLCQQAKQHNFYAVCINGCYVSLAKKHLKDSAIKIASVVGFPLGASASDIKVMEAKLAVELGADEIDMVINIGFLKNGRKKEVLEEIQEIKDAIGIKILKVILEVCYLSDEEIRVGCQLAKKAGADYVKTSTGFGTRGATVQAVKIMLEEVGGTMKVKAAGGIRNIKTAQRYIKMGVSRIGTSSGIQIVAGDPKTDFDEHTY